MNYAGIDVGKERHWAAVVDEKGKLLRKSFSFREDRAGYDVLLRTLQQGEVGLVVMEATGHYWRNLFAALSAAGFAVALVNPLRTYHFAAQNLRRAKTDAIDAHGLAQFAALHRPDPLPLPDSTLQSLKELVRLRDRLVQDRSDRLRQLHRVLDLVFPELRQHLALDSQLAWKVLAQYPSRAALQSATVEELAAVHSSRRHSVGTERAQQIRNASHQSVGAHAGGVWQHEVRFCCEDLLVLEQRIQQLEKDIEAILNDSEIGRLLRTIPGVGDQSAAAILAAVGDPASYESGRTFAAYAGVVPRIQHSGNRQPRQAGICRTGHAALRKKLWMPTLMAVRANPLLEAFYDRLIARGKPPKVAVVAAMRKLLTLIYAIAKNKAPFKYEISATAEIPA